MECIILILYLQEDGDVRDLVFSRNDTQNYWNINTGKVVRILYSLVYLLYYKHNNNVGVSRDESNTRRN